MQKAYSGEIVGLCAWVRRDELTPAASPRHLEAAGLQLFMVPLARGAEGISYQAVFA